MTALIWPGLRSQGTLSDEEEVAEGQSDVEVGIRALFERELDVAADGERAGPPDIPGMPFISDIPEIPVMSPVVAGASFVPAAR